MQEVVLGKRNKCIVKQLRCATCGFGEQIVDKRRSFYSQWVDHACAAVFING